MLSIVLLACLRGDRDHLKNEQRSIAAAGFESTPIPCQFFARLVLGFFIQGLEVVPRQVEIDKIGVARQVKGDAGVEESHKRAIEGKFAIGGGQQNTQGRLLVMPLQEVAQNVR